MTLVLDSSALLRRYIADKDRGLVLEAMAAHDAWVVSALARTEVELAIRHGAPGPRALLSLWASVRNDWEAYWQIPVDARCLRRATEVGAQYGLALVDALPLAAADRLPRPVSYCTFARQQIPAAAELGFTIISPFEP
ncbi:MAG: PIN domain-containing protein [Acidimicrobiales bacterium]